MRAWTGLQLVGTSSTLNSNYLLKKWSQVLIKTCSSSVTLMFTGPTWINIDTRTVHALQACMCDLALSRHPQIQTWTTKVTQKDRWCVYIEKLTIKCGPVGVHEWLLSVFSVVSDVKSCRFLSRLVCAGSAWTPNTWKISLGRILVAPSPK